MPQWLAGGGIGSNQGGTEQIVAGPVSTKPIETGRSERHVNYAARAIDSHEAPDIGAGTRFGPILARRILAPRVAIRLTSARHTVERPHQFAGSGIPGAHVAGGTARWEFLHGGTRDHQILPDDRRGGHAILAAFQPVHYLGRLHVDNAARAESGNRLPGAGIQCIEPAIARAEKQPWWRGDITRPIFNTTQGRLARAGDRRGPDFAPRIGFQCHHSAIGRGGVHHAIDDQRCGLRSGKTAALPAKGPAAGSPAGRRASRLCRTLSHGGGVHWRRIEAGRAHMIGPRRCKARNIDRIDLIERRMALTALVAAISGPIGSRIGMRRGQDWGDADSKPGQQHRNAAHCHSLSLFI